MLSNNRKLIAVIGATGQQGGGVLRALQARGQFKVRWCLSWSKRNCRDVQLLGGPYLSGFGFVRSNCSRKQSSRPGTDPVFDLGSGEFPQTAQRH
jgi:hypothetical protein